MRQDMRERERQIRRLHQSIQKYEQSPRTKKAVQQATLDLVTSIEDKFQKSEANNTYSFPRKQDLSDDEFTSETDIVYLNSQNDLPSHQLSIAEEAQSNHVYISEKTTLIYDKFSPFSKQINETKGKLKIKVVKSKNFQTTQVIAHKLDRLKTQHINFSTTGYKKQGISMRTNHHESSSSKLKSVYSHSQVRELKKKLKISPTLDYTYQKQSKNNLTMKTEYSHLTKRREGKQNTRTPLEYKQTSQSKNCISQHSVKKIQSIASRPYLNIKCNIKRKKQNENNNISFVQTQTKYKIAHKSSQNLKSIRLGRVSTEKLKTIKGLHA